MFVLDALVSRSYPQRVLQKGAKAPHTMRAESDAVFDLHETRAAELAEARQANAPIYDKDNQLFYRARKSVLDAARARALDEWNWVEPHVPGDESDASNLDPDGSVELDAGRGAKVDSASTDRRLGRAKRDRAGLPDAGGDGRPDSVGGTIESTDDEAVAELAAERRAEIEALVRGYFDLLEPFYKRGVVADTEFPQEKRTVRLLVDGRYVPRKVSRLHRFSDLHPILQRGAGRFFFKSDPRVRLELVDFILQRLPANVTYSKENERFITDISQVTGLKIFLIHRGAVLAARGDTIDTRAHYAIRASAAAARETSWLERQLGRYGLVGALLLLLGLAGRFLCRPAFEQLRSVIFIHGSIVLLFLGAKLALLHWPIHASLLPHVAIALITAVVLGRAAAVLVAIAVSAALSFTLYFDLTGIVIGAAGGVTAALIVRPRRRLAVLAAGVLVGLAQALAVEACRAATGQAQEAHQLWAAGQGFIGGLLCGPVALVGLPFVQRWLGQASRGNLEVLADFNQVLLRRLRERRPEVFAHSVRVMNLADVAAKAVGADRLLTRVGALLHDIGKLEQVDGPEQAQDQLPRDRLRRRQAHVQAGLAIARQQRLPGEVRAFIAQHHGTLPLEPGATDSATSPRFDSDLPATEEVVAVMFANRVARATRSEPTRSVAALVQQVMLELVRERQLVRCGISAVDLDRMGDALLDYLERHS
jgi:putative nucleotidyltransferase with HDIG domain